MNARLSPVADEWMRACTVLFFCVASLLSNPVHAFGCAQAPTDYVCRPLDVANFLPSHRAHGISNSGHVSGFFETPGARIFRTNAVGSSNIEVPPNPAGMAAAYGFGVNNAGEVVGYSLGSDGYVGFIWDGSSHNGSGYTTFQYQGTQTFAYGINNNRTVVGAFQSNGSQYTGLILTGNTFNTLQVPGANSTYLYGINDSGDLAGTYINATGEIVGFTRSSSAFEDVRVPGAQQTYVRGINNIGDVVGNYVDSAGSTKGFARLSDGTFWTFAVADALRTNAMGINDQRSVVGYYASNEFFSNGFIAELKPLPIPPAAALLAGGLLMLGSLVRRRSAKN